METLLVAVGSVRRPKLDAVGEALAAIAFRLNGTVRFEIAGVDAASGVRHTPLSREEMMAGARNRAEHLLRVAREEDKPWNYFVGLEGGIDVVHERGARWVFLENWACVIDRNGRTSFGQSGAVLLPEPLVKTVVDDGVELAQAIDAYAGGQGIRDAQGAWGVLTGNLITRKDSFRVATTSAFATFLSDFAR
jgi:inosine/xanthosine triphosphatase